MAGTKGHIHLNSYFLDEHRTERQVVTIIDEDSQEPWRPECAETTDEEVQVLEVKTSATARSTHNPHSTRTQLRRDTEVVDLTSTSHEETRPKKMEDEVIPLMDRPPSSNPVMGKSLKCCICLDDISHPFSTVCGHVFCEACIKLAVKQTGLCPTCRKKLTVKQLHRIFI